MDLDFNVKVKNMISARYRFWVLLNTVTLLYNPLQTVTHRFFGN